MVDLQLSQLYAVLPVVSDALNLGLHYRGNFEKDSFAPRIAPVEVASHCSRASYLVLFG